MFSGLCACVRVCAFAGVDQEQQRAVHSVPGQPAPAPVRGEAGQTGPVLHQGEGPQCGGLGPHLGLAGRQARDHCQECARHARQAGLGLLSGTAGTSLRLLPGNCGKEKKFSHPIYCFVLTCCTDVGILIINVELEMLDPFLVANAIM